MSTVPMPHNGGIIYSTAMPFSIPFVVSYSFTIPTLPSTEVLPLIDISFKEAKKALDSFGEVKDLCTHP